MSLKFAILGYLSTGPGTGWDISRQFDTGLGWFWTARHSQIYPELKRMTQDGLVERDSETVGEALERFSYSITDRGRALLAEFTASPPVYPPNRDAERLQLIFADDTPDALRPHLEAHRERHVRRRTQLLDILEALRANTHERINLRVANRRAEGKSLTLGLRELAYQGELQRAELEIAWANAALVWLSDNTGY